MAALLRMIARRPVTSFMVIGLGAGFLTAAIRPMRMLRSCRSTCRCTDCLEACSASDSVHSWSPQHSRGATASLILPGALRWCVPVRWYLVALFTVPVGATLLSLVIYGPPALASPAGGWPRALAEVAAVFLLQLVLFQLAEEIGFTGFLQHHWRDRYHPMELTLYVALLWAVWHLPDHFAEEGWGVEALISAPVVFEIELVSLFFARALFVWFYNVTGSSVLLVAIFHAASMPRSAGSPTTWCRRRTRHDF